MDLRLKLSAWKSEKRGKHLYAKTLFPGELCVLRRDVLIFTFLRRVGGDFSKISFYINKKQTTHIYIYNGTLSFYVIVNTEENNSRLLENGLKLTI